MNDEIISQIYSVKSSTIGDIKGLLHDIKHHKTQSLESRIRELEGELKKIKKSKRYGLVWEDKPEDVVERCKSELPLLKEVTSRRITKTDDDLHHILIEGDNYHALSTLAYTHAGKIDVIYIDPPYNTGNEDFMYNDKFLDKEDTFRHSKWLSFMNRRLRLAKKLLKEDGVIFISIDDNEQAQLKLLGNSIFGENNYSSLIWQKQDAKVDKNTNAKIINREKRIHEYILIFYNDKHKKRFNQVMKIPEWKNSYTNPDKDPRGNYKLLNSKALFTLFQDNKIVQSFHKVSCFLFPYEA